MKALKFQFQLLHVPCFLNITAFASGFGTKEEAATLLERGIALVRIDKNRALDLFTTGEGGLIQKDLYVFCAAPDGTLVSHPRLVGSNVLNFKDSEGTPVGELMFSNAKVGITIQVTYKLRRPTTGSDKEYTKTALVTRGSGLVCGVGYYRPQQHHSEALKSLWRREPCNELISRTSISMTSDTKLPADSLNWL